MGSASLRNISVYTLQTCADVHLLKEGVDLFNEAQRHFRATWSGDAGLTHAAAVPESEAPEGPAERYWSVSEVMASLRPSLPPDGALLVFTSELLASGRLVEVQSQVALVSTFGWDVDADPPRVDAFALYNLAACAFRLAGGHLHEAQTQPHDAPQGCLFDANVPDADRGLCALKIRLRCGYLCASHRVRLSSFESQCDEPLDAIDRVLDRVRTRAASTSQKGRATAKRTRQGRTLFSWVHLSDVHVGHGDESHVEDQKLTLQEVERDLKRLVAAVNVAPDVVLVTGDLAFSGATRTVDEYKRAKHWLRRVAASAGLTEKSVFLVPGNHDVQRAVDSDADVAALVRDVRTGVRTLDKVLANAADRARLARRMENYLKFARGFAPTHDRSETRAGASPALWWQTTIDKGRGLRVRLVGLNTALVCADEKTFGTDQRVLAVGMRQLREAFESEFTRDDGVIVVMTHHPFVGEWLRDERAVREWVRSHAHMHLTGHVHDADSSALRQGGGDEFITIAAGAVHEEAPKGGARARHGYSMGAMQSDDDRTWVRVWPRMWSEKRRGFRADVELLADGEICHDLDVELPALRGVGR